MEWTKYETHQEKMKTLIQSKNPPNQSIMSSIDEIQSFINRIHNLGSSYAEWLQRLSRHFYNPTRSTPTTRNQTPVQINTQTQTHPTQPGRSQHGHTRERSRTSTRSNHNNSRHSRRSHHSRASSRSSKPRSPVSPITPVTLGSTKHVQMNTRQRAKTPNATYGHTRKFDKPVHHPRGYKIRSSGHQRQDASALVTPVSVNNISTATKSPKSGHGHGHSRDGSSRTLSPKSPTMTSKPATPRPKPLPPPSMNSRSRKPPPPKTPPKRKAIPTRILIRTTSSNTTSSKQTKESIDFPPVSPIEKYDKSMNIRPSHARRLSANMTTPIPDSPQKKKKYKKKSKSTKKKKKSKKVKKDRDSPIRNENKIGIRSKKQSQRDRQSSTPASGSSHLLSQTSPSSPYYTGLQVDNMAMLYSTSEPNLTNLLDYDGRDGHNDNHAGNHRQHHHNDSHGSHQSHQSHVTRKFTSKSKSKSVDTAKRTNSGTDSTFVSGSGGFPALPTLADKSSLRSFGELFSKQFQRNVVHLYRKSILQNIDDETVLDCDDSEMAGFVEMKRDIDHSDEAVVNHPITVSMPNNPITTKQSKIAQYFHDNYHGQNEVFQSPFGMRLPVIYCDWTATAKSLQCVETYLQKEVMTLYGDTHSNSSITGVQTSRYIAEARSIILGSINGDHDEDVVLFTGTDITGSIYKMSQILMKCKSYKPDTTVVFASIYENNSNIFIWKELGCKVIIIPENTKDLTKGGIDLKVLENQLKFYTTAHMKFKYNLIIGSFSAANTINGIINPIDETTELLHKYGALSFWDYDSAGCYLEINMTNTNNPMLSKDAVFISPHKFLAGPGSPGILCAKQNLFENYVPVIPGNGSLFTDFGLDDGEWEYLDNVEEREESGTPNILGCIRAAFAFIMKDNLSVNFIQHKSKRYLNYFMTQTKSFPNLVILGNTECERLPILSWMITHSQKRFGYQKTKYLHHNFIAALLNDLFGIQGRGGSGNAGMYCLNVLNINNDEIQHILDQIRSNENEIARPGVFRINLHYTLNQTELEYIVNAIKYICKNGWKFLPLYQIEKETGYYVYRAKQKQKQNGKFSHITPSISGSNKDWRSLLDVGFDDNGKLIWNEKHIRVDSKSLNENFDKFFDLADDILYNLDKYLPTKQQMIHDDEIHDENAWYWLPSELYQDAASTINNNNSNTQKYVD